MKLSPNSPVPSSATREQAGGSLDAVRALPLAFGAEKAGLRSTMPPWSALEDRPNRHRAGSP
jgi:hypothetical protein